MRPQRVHSKNIRAHNHCKARNSTRIKLSRKKTAQGSQASLHQVCKEVPCLLLLSSFEDDQMSQIYNNMDACCWDTLTINEVTPKYFD